MLGDYNLVIITPSEYHLVFIILAVVIHFVVIICRNEGICCRQVGGDGVKRPASKLQCIASTKLGGERFPRAGCWHGNEHKIGRCEYENGGKYFPPEPSRQEG